ncbi:MAG: phosphoglycerate dehydrogenase [Candidatus Endonucleobacter sp. (ex Gigantidas childressi)]|nr:phosphoglycerate dehydrogenase [Candidatus Endonucleobacter sp. (ex Gigantidas childressi)]
MNVIVTSPSFSKNKKLQTEIYKFFPGTKLNLSEKRFHHNELIEHIKDADAIIVGLESINAEVLDACPKLKMISKYGVGLNNIDLKECKKRAVKIGWTAGVNKISVAEMTLGFMMMLSRNLFVTSNQHKNGIWNKSGGFELSGKTIGIIGVGYIGKEVIRLLKPFGCKIFVNDIQSQDEYYKNNNLYEASKEDIYKYSDIVTIHTPHNSTTNNMVDINVLKAMKDTAYILNTARGGIINEVDLKYALKNNIIAGAGIDAYLEEPPTDREFINLPNLICTPHIGGNSGEAVEAMGMSAISHLKRYFNI